MPICGGTRAISQALVLHAPRETGTGRKRRVGEWRDSFLSTATRETNGSHRLRKPHTRDEEAWAQR